MAEVRLDGSPLAYSTAVEAGVAEIGGDLRRARLARNQSIEDIARATKINSSNIRAIENDAFDKLPGGLFTRGFLRAFAREVGLDPDEIVARYRAEFELTAAAETADAAQSHDEPAPSVRPVVDIDGDAARSRQIQVLQLCIILLIVALYFTVTRKSTPPAQADVKPVAPPVVATSKQETPVATNGTVVPDPNGTVVPDLKPDQPLALELKPQGPCWIEATADGKRVFGKLMDAGQQETITVRDEVMLRIGDPGTFAFAINGVPGRPVGEAGRATWVRLDRQNFKTFLQPQP
jgi:cytoskeleton protein RodZ